MPWDVEYTDEFGAWWEGLTDAEQESVAAVVGLLEDHGPQLGYPHSSGVTTSRHAQMRELRIQHHGRPYRILYAFAPRRAAILLIGGDKTGNERWYDEFLPVADRLYDAHLTILDERGYSEMAKKFQELTARKPPAWHAAVEARKRQLVAEMPLHELRRARQLSQEQLATELGATQPEISKIERRTDMYVSTLRRFVEAMGGKLEIIAQFPDGTVRITQFHELD